MIIKAVRHEKDRTFFDKKVKFAVTKSDYVDYVLPIGSLYEVEKDENGYYSMPSKRNKR